MYYRKKRSPWHWLLLMAVLPLLVASCTFSDELDASISNRKNTVTLLGSSQHVTELMAHPKYDITDRNVSSSFHDVAVVYVYARQDGVLKDCGRVKSEVSADKHSLVCTYNEKGLINTTKPHTLYLSHRSMIMRDNNIYYESQLKRKSSYTTVAKVTVSKSGESVMGTMNGVNEVAIVRNNTDQPITFQHRGFRARQLWYYDHAEISLDNNAVVNAAAVQQDCCSDVETVPPYSLGKQITWIYSYYPPNGKKIQDATLVAEINGREVCTSNTLSSDVTLVPGHVYGYVLEWDGQELRFAERQEQEEENQDVDTLTSKIDLPDEASLKLGELTLLGDGEEVEMSQDGSFESSSSTLSLVNRDNEIVYFSVAASGETRPCKIKLGSMETAASMILETIPSFFAIHDKDDVLKLKLMVSLLDSTKPLAAAIDRSVARNGYLNVDDVMDEYLAAVREVYGKMGISTSSGVRHRAPVATPTLQGTNAYGWLVRLQKSKWMTGEAGGYWQCEFDVFNSEIQAYTCILKGRRNAADGLYYPYEEDDLHVMFSNLVKPMNISEFMNWGFFGDALSVSKWGEAAWDEFMYYTVDEDMERLPDFDKLATFFSESWEFVSNKNFKITDMTWDAVAKKGIKLDFYDTNDALMVVGPGANKYLYAYNFVFSMITPYFKLIWDEVACENDGDLKLKYDKEAVYGTWETIMQDFIIDLFTDSKFFAQITKDLSNPGNSAWDSMYAVCIEDLGQKILSYIDKNFKKISGTVTDMVYKDLITTMYQCTGKGFLKSLSEDLKYPSYYKCALKVLDIEGAMMFDRYRGVAFPMNLDFKEPGSSLPDVIPGYEFN